MVVSVLALVVALGGTASAAFGPFEGDALITKHSLSGSRLRNHTLTAQQIKLSKLGTVPNASNAGFASRAGSANTADTAGGAPPTGPASGDLTGNYPNPTIAQAVTPSALTLDDSIAGHFAPPTAGNGDTNQGPPVCWLDRTGIVHFQGDAVNQGGAAGFGIATLPAACPPPSHRIILRTVAISDNGATNVPIALGLEADGALSWRNGVDLTNRNVPLDGLSYRPGVS